MCAQGDVVVCPGGDLLVGVHPGARGKVLKAFETTCRVAMFCAGEVRDLLKSDLEVSANTTEHCTCQD